MSARSNESIRLYKHTHVAVKPGKMYSTKFCIQFRYTIVLFRRVLRNYSRTIRLRAFRLTFQFVPRRQTERVGTTCGVIPSKTLLNTPPMPSSNDTNWLFHSEKILNPFKLSAIVRYTRAMNFSE